MEENRKNSAAQKALQGGEYGVVENPQLDGNGLIVENPQLENISAPLEYIERLTPGTLEEKAAFINRLKAQNIRNENVIALCIVLVYMHEFDCTEKYTSWCREKLGMNDSAEICNNRRVGAMINSLHDFPEEFSFLMSIPYYKNVVLLRVGQHKEFRKFLREKRAEIQAYGREALAELRNAYFHLAAVEKEERPEQLAFDFAGFKTISQAATENPEKTARSIARKLKKFGAGKFLYGSLTMSAAAVVYLEEHPEELPADLGPYLAYLEELAASLKSIAPDTEK